MGETSASPGPPAPTSSSTAVPAFDNSNVIIQHQLRDYAEQLERELDADCLTLIGPITYGVEDFIREAIEKQTAKRERLAVILETGGGYIEVAQRIADILRHHYAQVDFIIPNFAMSAGTVLVMCGDTIWMDYFSILGPIDPQVERPGGGMVPALGYLIQYERLIEKSMAGTLSTAELMYLTQNFNPAELYRYEQARELSISLLKEWLVKYKFKDWKVTKTRKKPVTATMRVKRAEEIATKLNDTKRWNSHGRGISMEVLIRDLNLQIRDFEGDPDHPELHPKVRRYYRLLKDFMSKIGQPFVIHSASDHTFLARV